MAKLKLEEKHPALVMKQGGFPGDVIAKDDEDLRTLAAWNTFTASQKEFLAVLPWCDTYNEAAAMINRGKYWWVDNAKSNPVFAQAARSRRFAKAELARHFGADLIGISMLALRRILTPEEDGTYKYQMKDVLEAVKHVHKLNKLADDTAPGPAQQYIRMDQVNMFSFENNQKQLAKVVTPEGKEVE